MESRKERDLDRQSVLVTLLAAPIDGRAALIEEYRIRSEAAYARKRDVSALCGEA